VSRDVEVAESLREESVAVLSDYLPEAAWRALAGESRALYRSGAFRPAGVGRGAAFRIEPESRGDRMLWIDAERPSPAQAFWLARVERLRRTLNSRLFLGLFGFEAHLALYPAGARYATHLDRFADASQRRVSLVLYLNEAWSPEAGGALRLYLDEADRAPWRDVEPRGGTLVAFLSDAIHHAVLPASRERLSVVGWLTRRR
jgi:SM-20-related protein